MPQDPEKRRGNTGEKKAGTDRVETEIAINDLPPESSEGDRHDEETLALPVGAGIHRRVSANAIPGIDAIKELHKLELIPGIIIQTIPDKQQQIGKQPKPIPRNMEEYIHPSDLMKDVNSIKTWHLEMVLLQLQWRFDTDINPHAQQILKGLNNLGCLTALLGRYQNAGDYLEKAAKLALQEAPELALEKAPELALEKAKKAGQQQTPKLALLTDYVIILRNQKILKKVDVIIKQQDYWGKIGGSQ